MADFRETLDELTRLVERRIFARLLKLVPGAGKPVTGAIGAATAGAITTMKTTIDIHDELLARAKRYARRTGQPLRAVVEEGLRLVLSGPESPEAYRLPDLSIGDPTDADPLEAYSWQDLSEIIHEHPENAEA